MKKIFVFSICTFLSIYSYTQSISPDCSEYSENQSDKVTGTNALAFKNSIMISDDGGKTGMLLNALLDKKRKTMIMVFYAVSGGMFCADKGDRINILFRDGNRLELLNNGSFSCKAEYTIYFGGFWGKQKQLDDLASKEIEVIRLSTTTSSMEKALTPEQSNLFVKSVACLKSLMK